MEKCYKGRRYKKQTDNFIKNYLDINNDGGVASTDPRYEFDQLKSDAYVPNKPQMDSSKERIYSYFGTNENIIQSKFTEEEWNAYYENTIEPVAIQLSLEFTKRYLMIEIKIMEMKLYLNLTDYNMQVIQQK